MDRQRDELLIAIFTVAISVAGAAILLVALTGTV